MRAVDIIRHKRDGHPLSESAINAFVQGVTRGEWPDYQASALLMALWLRGMNEDETAQLTAAMVHSGVKLDWSDLPGRPVDKHSTGGVGDKTSLIIAPLVAACGGLVPMMSGRGLGHTGGTLDKLEAIPGFRVSLSLEEFRAALQTVGCALIGQTATIAPADRKLYALRDVTATVESIPLIAASILSKKIAEGIGGLVLDVKFGHGAFMKTLAEAQTLAKTLVRLGQAHQVETRALLTRMDAPLGFAVGNVLEVKEALAILRGTGPAELTELCVLLAAHMLCLAGLAQGMPAAAAKVRAALSSGQGLEKFRALIRQQHGDERIIDDESRLPAAPGQAAVKAPRDGYIRGMQAELVGRAAVLLGAGRHRAEDGVDPGAGILLRAHVGDFVRAGSVIYELYANDAAGVAAALVLAERSLSLGEAAPESLPLVEEIIQETAA